MSVSGSINYTQSAGDLADDALHLLSVLSPSETIDSNTKAFVLDAMNKMIKAWAGYGPDMWAKEEAALIFNNSTVKYSFHDKQGTGGSVANCVKVSGLVKTTISANEASGQTTISVTSSAGMATNDKILIELDDGTRHETTISSVPTSTTVVINSALADEASSGNYVFTYTLLTDEIYAPREIQNVRIVSTDNLETPLRAIGRDEYMMIVNKTQEGTPYTYYFNRLEGIGNISSSNALLYVFPSPDSLRTYLKFDVVKTVDDIDSSTDNFYFPDEWLEAITYNLAVRIAPAFGKEDKIPVLAALAKDALDTAIRFSEEDVPTQFYVDLGGC